MSENVNFVKISFEEKKELVIKADCFMLCFDKSWMLWFIFILNERFWRKGKDRKVIIPDLRKFGIMIPWRKWCSSRKIPIARGMGRWQNHFLNGLKKNFKFLYGKVLITLLPSFCHLMIEICSCVLFLPKIVNLYSWTPR